MIDTRNLAEGIRWLAEQLDAWGIFRAPSTGCADLLLAAKAYQSAVASKDAVNAAMMAYMRTTNATTHSHLMSDHVFDFAMHAALTAAKIKVAHQVNTDTLAGFDGGYDAGWQEAIETCVKLAFEQKYKDTGPRAVEIVAIAIRALKPPGG